MGALWSIPREYWTGVCIVVSVSMAGLVAVAIELRRIRRRALKDRELIAKAAKEVRTFDEKASYAETCEVLNYNLKIAKLYKRMMHDARSYNEAMYASLGFAAPPSVMHALRLWDVDIKQRAAYAKTTARVAVRERAYVERLLDEYGKRDHYETVALNTDIAATAYCALHCPFEDLRAKMLALHNDIVQARRLQIDAGWYASEEV